VEDEEKTFDERELFGQSRVEEDGKSRDCDDQKGSMPRSLATERILLVVKRDQPLDNRPAQESDGTNGSLPTGEAKPADNVGQKALKSWRRPL
jgi:hypothetical protein